MENLPEIKCRHSFIDFQWNIEISQWIDISNSENTIFEYSLFWTIFFLKSDSSWILGQKHCQKIEDVVYLSEIM